MAAKSEKIKFANEVLDLTEKLVQLMEKLPELRGAYFDNTWNSGGADVIIDGDVSTTNLTAAEIGSFITMAEQLEIFFAGTPAVTAADYASTLNKIRYCTPDR